MSEKLMITVMLGGASAEREVSLKSGDGVVKALRSLGHNVTELDPKNGSWKLAKGTDVVFLALHGTYGEDGTVQRELAKHGAAHPEIHLTSAEKGLGIAALRAALAAFALPSGSLGDVAAGAVATSGRAR